MEKVESVDAYIANFPPEIQAILEKIRRIIREEAPGATEKISYQMPTYWQDGNLVHFAAFKEHIGLYPMPDSITAFEEELQAYKHAKGSIRFPLSEPIPYGLIRKIVRHRVQDAEK